MHFPRVYRPIKRLALVNNHIKTLQGATDRVFEIMRTVPDIRNQEGAKNACPKRKAPLNLKTSILPIHRMSRYSGTFPSN